VDDPFKDFALLREALRMLEPGIARRCTLLLMGADTRSVEGDFGQVQVRSLGYVADERGRAEAYRSADMLAYPTRADNQPLVLIEAMACGLPAVACDVGGVGELVRNGRNGYLAPPGDAGAFCEGIRRLALDEAAREDLARACREDAEREFGEKAWVDLMRELYSRTLDSWRRS
jgi:glycosyltransferase involved in cell wall biosynthesis